MTEPTTQTTFYVPLVKKETPLKLDSDLLACSSKLPNVVKVRLKESAVAHQIATGLYKSPQAGFREVYSNERRAARTAHQKFGANPRIEITVDTEHRQLTIQGHDSLGITAQVFADVLRWMGRTTNNDENEVGQFGWGFFALWTLANSMELQTYARETNERYGVTAKDAGAFTLLLDEQVTIQEYGTKIQLSLKSDVNLVTLVDWIEENCKYSDVETHLTITQDLVGKFVWGYDHTELKKQRTRLDNRIKEYLQQQASERCEHDRILYDITSDTPDYYFYGVIGGDDEHAHLFGDEENREVLLLDVPIEAPEATSAELPFSHWVLNIKNERKYQPAPDRDRFLEGALKPIMDEVCAFIEEKLTELNITSFNDYRRATWKGIYAELGRSHESYWRRKWLDEQTRKVANLLSIEVILPSDDHKEDTAERERTRRSYGWHRRWKNPTYTQIRLGRLVARSEHLFYYEMPRRENGREIILVKKMDVAKTILRTQHEDAEVFTYIPPDRNSWDNEQRSPETGLLLRLLKEARGNVNPDAPGEAQKQKNKLGQNWRKICGLPERKRGSARSIDWPVHKWSDRGRVEPTRFKTNDLPSDALRIPTNVKRYIEVLALVKSKYAVTKDAKFLRGGLPFATFLDAAKHKTAPTKQGRITFENIANNKGKVVIYITNNPEILKVYIAPDADVMIATCGDEAFELMTYLTAKDQKYTIIRHPDKKNFHERTGVELEEIVGNYPSESDSESATIAYIGSSIIKTPQVRVLLIHAIESLYSAEEAQVYLDRALALDSALRKSSVLTNVERGTTIHVEARDP